MPSVETRTQVYGISWRPDGQELALASIIDGVVLFKPDGNRFSPLPELKSQVWPELKSQVWTVSWGPEPQHTLAAGGFLGTVIMWNTASPCKVPLGNWIWSMSWRPDGKSLAVGLGDHTVRLLLRDCKEGPRLNGHTEPVTGVSWSSDCRLATASGGDRTVKLWDKEGTLLDTFQCPTVMGGVQWRPDGQVLATLDQYGLVRLWKDNPLLKTFIGPAHAAVNDAALSPDGHILACASDNGINLWRQDQDHKWLSKPNFLPLGNLGNVSSVSWSPDGQLLAFTTFQTVTILNRDGTSKETLKDNNVGNGVLTVSWHPNGRIIATGDGELNITLWDINNKSILGRSSFEDWAQSVAWNPVDERLLAVGCHNKAGAYLLKWKPDKKEIERIPLLKSA